MAITRETLHLVAELRRTLADITDARTRALTAAWVRAWDELAGAVAAGLDDVLAQVADNRWPSRATILRTRRLIGALDAARQRLETLAATTAVGVSSDIGTAVPASAAAQAGIIGSQLPAAGGPPLAGAPQTALDAIVARTSQQVTSMAEPLSRQAYEAMQRTLIRGVAVGDNPRTMARQMLRAVEGQFNGGLTRALVIARTETLDAYRAAAAAEHQANAGVLGGWQWHSARDKRTCPSCWAKDGNTYPLDTPGPQDHQQGRCVRLPVTKSWRDLGINMPEPPSALADARIAFDQMPETDQLAVMGPARLELVQSGRVSWQDLSTRRTTAGWRPSYAPTPVRALTRTAAAA